MNFDLQYHNEILKNYADVEDEYGVPLNLDHLSIINNAKDQTGDITYVSRSMIHFDPFVYRVYQSAQMMFEISQYRNTKFINTELLSYDILITGIPYKTSFFYYVCNALDNNLEKFDLYHQQYRKGFEDGLNEFVDFKLNKILLMALTDSQKMKNLWDFAVNRWDDLGGPKHDESNLKSEKAYPIGSVEDPYKYAYLDGIDSGHKYSAWSFILHNQYGLRDIAKEYVNERVFKDPHLYSDLVDDKILKKITNKEKKQWSEYTILTQYNHLTVSELAMYFYIYYKNELVKSQYDNYTDLQKELLAFYDHAPNTSLYQEYCKIRNGLGGKRTTEDLDEYADINLLRKYNKMAQIASEVVIKLSGVSRDPSKL